MTLEEQNSTGSTEVGQCTSAHRGLASHVSRREAISVLVRGGIPACFPAFLTKLGVPGATAEANADHVRITAHTTRKKLIRAIEKMRGVTVVEY